VKIEPI